MSKSNKDATENRDNMTTLRITDAEQEFVECMQVDLKEKNPIAYINKTPTKTDALQVLLALGREQYIKTYGDPVKSHGKSVKLLKKKSS